MAHKYHNPVTWSNVMSWVGAESYIHRITSIDLILEFQRRLMKAVNDMLEYAGNKALQRARHSIPAPLWLFYDGSKIAELTVTQEREFKVTIGEFIALPSAVSRIARALLEVGLEEEGKSKISELDSPNRSTAQRGLWTAIRSRTFLSQTQAGTALSWWCKRQLYLLPHLFSWVKASMDYWNTRRWARYWVLPKFWLLINVLSFSTYFSIEGTIDEIPFALYTLTY